MSRWIVKESALKSTTHLDGFLFSLFSKVEALSVWESSICIDLGLKSWRILGLCSSTHDTDLVNLKKGLEEISTTNFEKPFNFVVARVIPETFVVEICLIKLNWRSFIAHHKLLEIEEAQVPWISFLISEETWEGHRAADGRSHFELPL